MLWLRIKQVMIVNIIKQTIQNIITGVVSETRLLMAGSLASGDAAPSDDNISVLQAVEVVLVVCSLTT